MSETIGFHTAWGLAYDRADYNKENWKRTQRLLEQHGRESEQRTLDEWLGLVTPSPIEALMQNMERPPVIEFRRQLQAVLADQ